MAAQYLLGKNPHWCKVLTGSKSRALRNLEPYPSGPDPGRMTCGRLSKHSYSFLPKGAGKHLHSIWKPEC